MGESRRSIKPTLPVAVAADGDGDDLPPSAELARERLGGAGVPTGPVGDLVRVKSRRGDGTGRTGVVLYRDAEMVDIWIGYGQVQRVAVDRVEIVKDEPAGRLREIQKQAAEFGQLRTGDRVVYSTRDRTLREGTLRERCRYGALVTDRDGRVIAVTFRRIQRAP